MTWAEFTVILLQAIALIPRDRSRRTEHQSQTLQALSKAYHATGKYYAYLDEDNKRDKQNEMDLGWLWEEASIFVREYDDGLANRLGMKSRFWREGAAWTNQEIENAGIQLERVRAEGMSLFEDEIEKRT